jgi:hypothetical protein
MHRRVESDTPAVCPPLHVTARKYTITPLHTCANTHEDDTLAVCPQEQAIVLNDLAPIHVSALSALNPRDDTLAVCPSAQAIVLNDLTPLHASALSHGVYCTDITPLHVRVYVNEIYRVNQIDTKVCTQIPPNPTKHFILLICREVGVIIKM